MINSIKFWLRTLSHLLCPHRTFLASVILASKFLQDKCYSNCAWAKLSGCKSQSHLMMWCVKHQHQQVQTFKLYIEQLPLREPWWPWQLGWWKAMLPYNQQARDRAGQRKGQQPEGWPRHNMSQAPQYVFFLLLTFYLLNIYLHLELLQWQQTATTTTHHLHLQVHDECRLEMQLRLEFWYVNFFFVHYYIIIYC